MTFTHKLSKRLAVLRPLVLLAALAGCSIDVPSGTQQITQLVLVPESLIVDLSQTYPLTVYGRTKAGDSVHAQGVTWTSDNVGVATVSSSGVITSHDSGTATITASTNGQSAHTHVHVHPGAPPPPPPPPPQHAGWHVTPSGSSSNAGTASSPWSLSFAVGGASGHIQPGDTVWLHGGTYYGPVRATVAGTPGNPVVFRQFPGERATIDMKNVAPSGSTSPGDAFTVTGDWTEWWDFELMSSDPNRTFSYRPNMMINDANNTKYIDLVVHDGGDGFFNYETTSNVEFYGNISYNNGWQETGGKGAGHGFYVKSGGPALLKDNVVFNNFNYGIHHYTVAGGTLTNMTMDGNVSFNTGSVTTMYNSEPAADILEGGEVPVSGDKILNNMTYFSPGYGMYNLMIGYSTTSNVDLALTNNYAVGGQNVLTTGQWSSLTATGNQLFGSSGVVGVRQVSLGGYSWGQNSYQRDPTASAWQYNGTNYSFASWKTSTGLGASDVTVSAPSGPKIFVRSNPHVPGRAMIVVYNWNRASSVSVDLSGVLPTGNYEVRNVQDWYGTPVTTGAYSGSGSISIPMSGVTPPAVVGGAPHTPPRTGPDFDVFIVRPIY
jgi:parallel beta-helix repeat protein